LLVSEAILILQEVSEAGLVEAQKVEIEVL
jgi:hypothetical protein